MEVVKIEYERCRYILCVYETEKVGDRELEFLMDIVAVAPESHPEILAIGFGILMAKGTSYSTIRKTIVPENAPHKFMWVSKIPEDAVVICELEETCRNEPHTIYLVAIQH